MDEQLYRRAEQRLWDEVGAAPVEHRVHLNRNDVGVRVLELGEGPPAVFLHGGPGASGAIWASLAARLPHIRCLLVDRPGTGLSAAQLLADSAAARRQSESMLVDVLDAFGIDRAHVVASSHGSHVAILSSALHPGRVERSVHLGCPGFVEGMRLTTVDRLVLLPGAASLFSRMPVSERGLRQTFRQLGHGELLERDGLSPATVDWMLALQRHTDTMRNEFAAMQAMGTFRRGFDPELTITAETLSSVVSPSLFLWGEHDVYGGAEVARSVVDAMPTAELELLPGAGHLCWFDEIDRVAGAVDRHLLAHSDA